MFAQIRRIYLLASYLFAVILPVHGRSVSGVFTDGYWAVDWVESDGGGSVECVVYDVRNETDPYKFIRSRAHSVHLLETPVLSILMEKCFWTKSDSSAEKMARGEREVPDAFKGIFPGTKWCGMGDRASNTEDLGLLEETDRCCREHDTKCDIFIKSGERAHDVHNTEIYTMNNCQCDEKFRQCLTASQTVTAATIGDLFFNVVKTKCLRVTPVIEDGGKHVRIKLDIQESEPFKKSPVSSKIGADVINVGQSISSLFSGAKKIFGF